MRFGLPILLFHRVGLLDGSGMDRYTVHPERFAQQMEFLLDDGWSTVDLSDFVSGRTRPTRPKTFAITFDDGFDSNREHAWPTLAACGFQSTTFLVSGEIGGCNSWDGADMRRYPLLDQCSIAAAERGLFSFQSHTCTHRALPALERDQCIQELEASRSTLEQLTGAKVTVLAYPFGAWDRKVQRLAKECGYAAAVTCRGGRNTWMTDPHLLRRVEIVQADGPRRLRAKVLTGINFT